MVSIIEGFHCTGLYAWYVSFVCQRAMETVTTHVIADHAPVSHDQS